MRESQFIKRNKEKWKNFESLLNENSKKPGDMREQFIQVTDDLSYSRTFYKNRSVRVYLNSLAQRIYHNLIKNKGNQWKSLKKFFTDDIQLIAYNARQQILLAFFVAILGFAIGFLTTTYDPEFPSSFFGNSYVETTKENIKSGDPLGIYKSGGPFESFIMIGSNNMRVAFMIFVAGLLFSFGAMAITFYNGIMVGVFMCFFYQYGIVKEFHLTVWMHGTIEMLSMVIECSAGILLGKGLLFPGTYTRAKAFFINARRGALLMLATIPLIVFAAFIEGYITRYTNTPDILRGSFIVACLIFMVGYFVVIPYIKFHKKNKNELDELGDSELFEDKNEKINTDEIKSFGQIFSSAIAIAMRNSKKWGWVIILGPIILSLTSYFVLPENLFNKFNTIKNDNTTLSAFGNFFMVFENITLLSTAKTLTLLLTPIWLGFLTFKALHVIRKSSVGENVIDMRSDIDIFKKSTLFYLVLFGVFSFKIIIINWLLFLSLPLFYLVLFKHFVSPKGTLKTSEVLSIGKGKSYTAYIYLIIMFLALAFFIYSPIISLGIQFFDWVTKVPDSAYETLIKGFFISILYATIGFMMFLFSIWNGMIALTHSEIIHAKGLSKQIDHVGVKPKFYGIETE